MSVTRDSHVSPVDTRKTCRDSQIFENVPWASYYARHIPRFTHSVQKFRALCVQHGLARYEKGSDMKDLFYYLVRVIIGSLCVTKNLILL